jgi:hypothetical protein
VHYLFISGNTFMPISMLSVDQAKQRSTELRGKHTKRESKINKLS